MGRTCGVQSGGVGGRARRIWRACLGGHGGGHPLAGEGRRGQGGEEDGKGLHLGGVGKKMVAVGGRSGWPDRLVWNECALQYRADEHKHKRT